MKLVFGIAFLSVTIPSILCACRSMEELDNCAVEISFLKNRARSVPKNDAEVVAMCGRAREGFKCLKDDLATCQKDPLKGVGSMIMTDLESHLNTRCDSASHRADFLQHVQCFRDKAKADAVRLCADKYMVMLERLLTMPKEAQHGGSCCANHLLTDCATGQIKSLCSGQTGDYFYELIQEATEAHVTNVCKEYPDLATCDAKYDATALGQLKAIQASDAAAAKKHQYKTFVPIIIKMMS